MTEIHAAEPTSSVEVMDELVKLVQDLTERPTFGELPGGRPGARPGNDRGIPLVCLVREPRSAGLLKVLRAHLRGAYPGRVPHAYHQFPDAEDENLSPNQVAEVGAVLAEVARELSGAANGRYGRHVFPRFRLVYWLMNQHAEGGEHESATSLLTRLRERDLRGRSEDDLIPREAFDTAADAAPWWARVALKLLPAFLFRAKLRGLVPGREYRWLLRQPYLAPHDPGTFLGFAERLTGTLAPGRGSEPHEDAGQLAKLLVNAFLEDVRRGYRRSLWRVRSARRTVYPVVLLDGIRRDNGGYALLKLINDVRNDTGSFDPLIIISGSEKVPPDAAAADERAPAWVENAGRAYETWTRKLATNSRARRPTAWFLPLRVPPVEVEPGEVPPLATLTVRPAPIWSRTSVLVVVVVLLLGAVAAGGYWRITTAAEERDRHCGLSPGDSNFETLTRLDPADCVGVSSRAIPLLDSGSSGLRDRFMHVQDQIAKQNEKVEQAKKDNQDRPYATVVYVSAMSGQPELLATNTARLMGVAAMQARLLDDNGNGHPLIRVLLGNAGRAMQYGDQLVEHLKTWMRRDPTIVGVLGLAQSRQTTLETVVKLGGQGLPTVAATLSANQFPAASSRYFQISPTNDREALVAVEYANKHYQGKNKVQIVRSADEKDLYSTDLARSFRARFTDKSLGETREVVDDLVYQPTTEKDHTDARAVGQQLCASTADTLVVYAGRPGEFSDLLDGIAGTCPEQLALLAGDDVMRHAADADLRGKHPSVEYDVLSFAVGAEYCNAKEDIYRKMQQIFKAECDANPRSFVDGQATLAYDALDLYSHAMKELFPVTRPSSGDLWKTISDIGRLPGIPGPDPDPSSRPVLNGKSGPINFQGGQVPRQKRISVLRVTQGDPPALRATCDESCVLPAG
ncbi:ABC transporter substrate-binding protein [Actinosynnema sp. CS-041913]|uniref:ABC transporter substrate-binding protein n=1 Tax=Actinosynnema sp. CS-041913 TaxID=3239917 RepID=UPI003D915071